MYFPIGYQSHPKVRQIILALRATKQAAPLLRLHRQKPVLRELANHPIDSVVNVFFQQNQISQKIIDAGHGNDIRTFSDFLSNAFPGLRENLSRASTSPTPPKQQLLLDAFAKITAASHRFIGFFHKNSGAEGLNLTTDFISDAKDLEAEVGRAYEQVGFNLSTLSNPEQVDEKYLDLIDSGFQVGSVKRLLMMRFTKTRKKIRTLGGLPLPDAFFDIATWRGWGNPLMHQSLVSCKIPNSFCRSMQVLLVLEAVTLKQSVGILAGQSSLTPDQAYDFRNAMENVLGIVSRAIDR